MDDGMGLVLDGAEKRLSGGGGGALLFRRREPVGANDGHSSDQVLVRRL